MLPGGDVDRDPRHRAVLETAPGAVEAALRDPDAILERLARERAARVLRQLREIAVVEDRRPDHLTRREPEPLERLALRQRHDPLVIGREEDHRRHVDDRRQPCPGGVELGARLVQRGDVQADALGSLAYDRDLTFPDPEPVAVAPAMRYSMSSIVLSAAAAMTRRRSSGWITVSQNSGSSIQRCAGSPSTP
jgi:hypothetical protein